MSIEPGKHPLKIWKGATFKKVLVLRTGDEDSAPRDLTGYTAKLVLKKTDGTLLETLTTENGGVALGGVEGTIRLYISDDDTQGFPWKSAQYELFLIDSDGDSDVLLYGSVRVNGIGG